MTKAFTIFTAACAISVATGALAEPVTRTIELNGVNVVRIAGNYNVVVKQGAEEFVRVTVEENDLEKVQARIKGETLTLGNEQSSWNWWHSDESSPDASFEIQLRQLHELVNMGSGAITLSAVQSNDDFSLRNMGSGSVNANNVNAEDITLNTYGSGNMKVAVVTGEDVSVNAYGSGDAEIEAIVADDAEIKAYGSGAIQVSEGKVKTLETNTYGSGSIAAGNLVANKVDAAIYGSGDITINVAEELEVDIFGSGDVTYDGTVTSIDKSSHGSGDVIKAR